MSLSVRSPATYDDLLQVPDHLIAEILGGDLYASPRPALPHAHAASALAGDLHHPFGRGRGGPGGWWILFEPELHLSWDVFVPDLAGWRRDRLPRLPDTAAMALAPDWVCEILSPSTARLDRAVKMPLYAREGVRHLWLIDPAARTLEVFRLEGTNWLLVGVHAGESVVRVEPFAAIEIELAALWGEPPAEE
jgi:Uma2 family endonuclease